MTTTASRRDAGGAARVAGPLSAGKPRSTITGTGTLVRFMLRRDRIKLPLWIGGLGLYIIYIGAALPQLAPDEAGLAGAAILFESPVGRMWVGPAFGMEAVTFERFFAAAYALYLHLLAALMNILLIARQRARAWYAADRRFASTARPTSESGPSNTTSGAGSSPTGDGNGHSTGSSRSSSQSRQWSSPHRSSCWRFSSARAAPPGPTYRSFSDPGSPRKPRSEFRPYSAPFSDLEVRKAAGQSVTVET